MELLSKLNSPAMYLLCGGIILFVAVICVIFAVRAYRAGKALGIDVGKMKRVITASATFSVLPGIGILLGVIALSGSLGTPWPWLRLSVIGALHYETQVAEAASEAVGLESLSISNMTSEAFTTIALLMCFCIIWGMVLMLFNGKAYINRLNLNSFRDDDNTGKTGSPEITGADGADAKTARRKKNPGGKGFGDVAMTAMFIGLVSAYIASYIGTIVSGNGFFTFTGSWLSLAVSFIAGLAMAGFLFVRKKTGAEWLDSFSVAGSMLIAMASAILLAG